MTLTMFGKCCPVEPGGEKSEDINGSKGEGGPGEISNKPDGREEVLLQDTPFL